MTEMSKYVNILIEYAQKIQGHLHKKYRPDVKKIINLKDLAKNVNPQSIKLTSQIIVFKLGIQSKSIKSIQISLNFLLKLFKLGFIDLNENNYCEAYQIGQAKIQKKQVDQFQTQMRHEFVRLLSPLVHFKNNQINALSLKIYKHLISENILLSLLEISEHNPAEQTYQLILSYCSYRIYLFEESYVYTEDQMLMFKHLPKNQRVSQQIQNAVNRHESLANLVQRYVQELVSKVAEEGGKYGLCVICSQPADYFCKITKASLCGLQCKKKHLQIAEKQYRSFYQSYLLWNGIQETMKILCTYLSQKESPFLFSALAKIIQNPSLFMIIRQQFKVFIRQYIPKILDKIYQSKFEENFQTLHFFMSYLAKWWPTESLVEIQYFLKENVVKILTDKRPIFRHMMLTFKSIDRIFECGKTLIELYVNLDCEINRPNLIGQILFQLSKIAQDKFQNINFYSKQQKIALKNSCVTLFHTLTKSLNQFRKLYPENHQVQFIIKNKQKKIGLQQFVEKFNYHWSEGLKSLFNLNIVGLDSNQQIVNIIMIVQGLKKQMLDSMLFDTNCKHYLQIFMFRLSQEPENLMVKLISYYQYLPLTSSASVYKKYFVQYFSDIFKGDNLSQKVSQLTEIFIKAKNLQDFSELIHPYNQQPQINQYLYMRVLNARKNFTSGSKNHYYQLCMSHNFIQVTSSQISLLQIPISYLLQTNYPPQKIIQLIRQLIPICKYSNWLSLLAKNAVVSNFHEELMNQQQMKLLKGVMDLVISQANFIIEWQTPLCLLSRIHQILTQNVPQNKKYFHQNRSIISNEISVNLLDNCLINCSLNVRDNFQKFMSAVLGTAKEQLNCDNVFLLQKFFHILDVNLGKYLRVFDEIFGQFVIFVKELKANNNQTLIYISDMMKQFLLKLLKSQDLSDRITKGYFQVFLLILQKQKNQDKNDSNNKQVGDFVMNCISTIIMHFYHLKPNTWLLALNIMEDYAEIYPYQTGVMIRKILNQKMQNLNQHSHQIIRICFKLINPQDQKTSIEAVHNIKMVISYKDIEHNTGNDKKQQNKQEDQLKTNNRLKNQETEQMLKYSLEQMIKLLDKNFNQNVMQVIFNLFNFKINNQKVVTAQNIYFYLKKAFERLQSLPKQQQQSGQRILIQALYWCVKNGVYIIIKNLEELIIGKYTYLSIDAMKCIKTYIQMANPRDQHQWKDVQQTLLKIIKQTQILRYFSADIQNFPELKPLDIVKNQCSFNISTSINITHFYHECRLQSMAVQLLPNDYKCLQVLKQVYKQKISFNNNIALRVGLWKQGLGKQAPPQLLTLQEIISNRIMAIYLRINSQQQILQFCYDIFDRYSYASKKIQEFQQHLEQASNQCNQINYQYYMICLGFWQKRRSPMLKLICYILPKLHKYCIKNQERKIVLKYLAKMLPLVEKRDPFLKSIKQLVKKKYEQ